MKKFFLQIIKPLSLILSVSFLILFIITFLFQSYFISKWTDYLEEKMYEKIKYELETKNKLKNIVEENTKKISNRILSQQLLKWNEEDIFNEELLRFSKILVEKWQLYIKENTNITIPTILDKIISKEDIKWYINNVFWSFFLDLRIFIFTNFLWFFIVYLLTFNAKRPDVIRNMFYPTIILLFCLIWWFYYYIFWQNWVENILTNEFFGYLYPILLLIFSLFFIIFQKFPKQTFEVTSEVIDVTAGTMEFTGYVISDILLDMIIFKIEI